MAGLFFMQVGISLMLMLLEDGVTVALETNFEHLVPEHVAIVALETNLELLVLEHGATVALETNLELFGLED